VKFNGSWISDAGGLQLLAGQRQRNALYRERQGVQAGRTDLHARNGTGDYTLTLQDKFIRVLQAGITFIGSANAAAPLYQLKVASNPNAAGATTANGWTSSAEQRHRAALLLRAGYGGRSGGHRVRL
jgi:hypothetical protein